MLPAWWHSDKCDCPGEIRHYCWLHVAILRTVIMVTFRHLFLDNTCPFSYLHNNCYFVLSCNPNFFFRIGEYLHNCTLFLASNTQSINTHVRWMKYTTHTWFMVFISTFNNISAISWCSILFVKETGVPGDNHRSFASHWQTLSHNVASSTPRHERDSNSQL
jgi:hypothetical protein